jgi:dihydroorotase-like cyclic amidohydrolase
VRHPGHPDAPRQAPLDGTIEILPTDHAPHLREETLRDSIWDCAPGFPGVETSMRLMLTEVSRGRLTLPQYVRMACAMPAKAFGLHPDARHIARLGPAGMIFIPCWKGISHNEAESATKEDCAAAAQVIADVLIGLAL